MNIIVAYRYQMKENYNGCCIYYGVILCILISFFIGMSIVNSTASAGEISGFDAASIIFLFVTGVCAFGETFRMFLQNGVSRKTLFKSRLLTMISLAAIFALIDTVILSVAKGASTHFTNVSCLSLYDSIYRQRISEIGFLLTRIESIMFDFCLYCLALSMGYFIALLYYRMSKGLKIAVSVGVPVCCFMVLPILDSTLLNGKISYVLKKVIEVLVGTKTMNPYNALITCLILSVVLSGLAWRLIKKATIKA